MRRNNQYDVPQYSNLNNLVPVVTQYNQNNNLNLLKADNKKIRKKVSKLNGKMEEVIKKILQWQPLFITVLDVLQNLKKR